jgi:uncharacterized protein YceK
MARVITAMALTVGLAGCLVGCGTVGNFVENGVGSGSKEVYGGVEASFDWARYVASSMTDGPITIEKLEMSPVEFVVATYFLAVDMPLSAVGDTLTLPLTLTPTVSRAVEHWKSSLEWKFEPAPRPPEPTTASWVGEPILSSRMGTTTE